MEEVVPVRRPIATRKLTGAQPVAMKGLVKRTERIPAVAVQDQTDSSGQEELSHRSRSAASAALHTLQPPSEGVGGVGGSEGPPIKAKAELLYCPPIAIIKRQIGIASNYRDAALNLQGLGMSHQEEEKLYCEIEGLCEHVTAVDLSRNCFRDLLSTSPFASLNALTHLNLDDNGLTHVPCALYSTLPLLTHLSLAGNLIRHFAPSAESSSIAVGSVDCCCASTLSYLDLSRNRFHELPDLRQFQRLRVLSLNGNVLSSLPDSFGDASELLPQLKSLHLEDNALTCLPPQFDCRATQLIELRLAGNEQLPESLAINYETPAAKAAWIEAYLSI